MLALGVAAALIALGPERAWGKQIDGVVNLNTAAPEVLVLLPGIGPSKAQAILDYRRKHPFRVPDELVRIKGIGRSMVRRLRPHLAVAGPTTARASAPGATPTTRAPPPTEKISNRPAGAASVASAQARAPVRTPARPGTVARAPVLGPRVARPEKRAQVPRHRANACTGPP